MKPIEVWEELKKLGASIGPDAYVSAGLYGSDGVKSTITEGVLYCRIYPHGLCSDGSTVHVEAHDWPELVEKAKAKWSAHSAEHRRQQVRKMALAIIRITAEHGHCTDAALRGEFSVRLVRLYAHDAIADANAIASNGPFSIVSLGGENGAPADLEPSTEAAPVH